MAANFTRGLRLPAVLAAVPHHFQIETTVFTEKHSALLARDVGAWLVRRLTPLTLRELSSPFGVTHPDSVSNLTRRAERALAKSPRLRSAIDRLSIATKNQPISQGGWNEVAELVAGWREKWGCLIPRCDAVR